MIAAIVVVRADGTVERRSLPADPYIYHHKWLFVAEDYAGFDVEESKRRSQQWIALEGVDRSRIGRKRYWEQHVVPRLNDKTQVEPVESSSAALVASDAIDTNVRSDSEDTDPWLRSNEVRRALKLSTCDLAHLREAGNIESKKVGNSYLYKLPLRIEDQ